MENVNPLNVGLLLFNDEPHDIFRGAKIELVVYEDDIGDKFQEHVFTGPIYKQLRSVLSFIKNNVIKEHIYKIDGVAESIRFYNYPFEAIEEAIANAVYHKSYEKENPIEINVRHDCIEILSLPGPLPPINNMMLKKDRIIARDYRNSRLGDFLKELHLTEGRGTGIPKIRSYMKKNGSPDPIFETDHDSTYFLTTLGRHKQYTNTEKSIIVTDEQKLVLQNCRVASSLKELMVLVGRIDRTKFTRSIITPLVKMNLLEMTIPDNPRNRNQKYKLSKYGNEIIDELLSKT